MSKEELLQFEGLVLERMPNARHLVQLDNRHQLVAYTAGRMKKSRIKTLAEDRVTVEVSLCDLEKGRLIFRHRTNEPLWSRGSRNAVNSAGDSAGFSYRGRDVAAISP